MAKPLKPLLLLACLLPFLWLLWRGWNGALGANPIETITRFTGDWTLRLLLLTLAVTPLRRLTGWSWPLRQRRMLGLFSFFYACLHLLTYALLDQGLSLGAIAEDIVKRPYITLGFLVFLLLVPLAATSSNAMIKRLGGRHWRRLHRLVYLCGLGGVIHYLWLVKADLREPLIYLGIVLLLFALRLPLPGMPIRSRA